MEGTQGDLGLELGIRMHCSPAQVFQVCPAFQALDLADQGKPGEVAVVRVVPYADVF